MSALLDHLETERRSRRASRTNCGPATPAPTSCAARKIYKRLQGRQISGVCRARRRAPDPSRRPRRPPALPHRI